jgi:hypothetical protein
MNDAQRYRMNAAECLLAAERCGRDYRDLTFAIAASVASAAPGFHERTFRDFERNTVRRGCANTGCVSISPQTESRSDHWVSSAGSYFVLMVVCRTGF